MAVGIDDIVELQVGPVGWGIAAASGVFALSPAVRQRSRRAVVQSLAVALAATAGLKQRTAEWRETWEDLCAEVQYETEARRRRERHTPSSDVDLRLDPDAHQVL